MIPEESLAIGVVASLTIALTAHLLLELAWRKLPEEERLVVHASTLDIRRTFYASAIALQLALSVTFDLFEAWLGFFIVPTLVGLILLMLLACCFYVYLMVGRIKGKSIPGWYVFAVGILKTIQMLAIPAMLLSVAIFTQAD